MNEETQAIKDLTTFLVVFMTIIILLLVRFITMVK
jgi:hypothetical protein